MFCIFVWAYGYKKYICVDTYTYMEWADIQLHMLDIIETQEKYF